jgi:hypothetical protein
MLNLDLHVRFDNKLKEKGIIKEDTPGDTVHNRIEQDMEFFDQEHKSVDYYFHNIDGIRSWINSWAHLAHQETKTDYVRIALAHLVLKDIESRKQYTDEKNLFWRALISFSKRGFHKTFFKERQFLTTERDDE